MDEERESTEGFRCGDRIVIAFQLSPQTVAANPELRLRLKLPRAPRRAERVTSTGERAELPCTFAEGELRLTCPLTDLTPKVARNWGKEVRFAVGYVVVEQ